MVIVLVSQAFHMTMITFISIISLSKVIAHAPMLDLGGLIKPGTIVRMTESKAGGKTSHAVQLVRQVRESLFVTLLSSYNMLIGKRADRVNILLKSLNDRVDEVECGEGGFTWVGAHPSLGNKVTDDRWSLTNDHPAY